MNARNKFSNFVYFALGNHECTGGTSSNCGSGNTNGLTNNYKSFMSTMLAPIGQSKPYYEVDFSAGDNSWTAKFVVIAANAWDSTQASWMSSAMSKPTTYTFVVRHEGAGTTGAPPGVSGSATILSQHPYTAVLAGHTHTFYYGTGSKEIITGNGGAPLSGSINYGYVIARRRADGSILFSARDYATKQAFKNFAINPDGSAAP
jgi:hypothetical protein